MTNKPTQYNQDNTPLIKGGQSRTPAQLNRDATDVSMCIALVLSTILMIGILWIVGVIL